MERYVLVMMMFDLHGVDVGTDRLGRIEVGGEPTRVQIGHQGSQLQHTVSGLDPLPYIVATPISLKEANELWVVL